MSINDAGKYAEEECRKFLKKYGYNIFQADWIAQNAKGEYFLIEVKHQEIYEPPPFYGHGLPFYQVLARLNFQKATGVIAILLILDKKQKVWYFQRLDELEKGEFYDTKGNSPRRVYDINSFGKEAISPELI